MDPRLLKAVSEQLPKFTEKAVLFHKEEFDNAVTFYERSLRMIFSSLKSKGVEFHSLSLVRPEEMYNHVSKVTTNKTFEINRESLFPVKLIITYRDRRKQLHVFEDAYVMLPYTNDYGDVYIQDGLNSLQIVLVDRGLSVTKEEQIFIKILGYKFKIGIENTEIKRHFKIPNNYKSINIPLNLPANRFYSPTESYAVKNVAKTPQPLLAWYIFAEKGVAETFKEYGEAEVVIGDLYSLLDSYPEKEGWEIYSTSGRKPEKSITATHVQLEYGVAVRPISSKRKEISVATLQYVGSLLYLFDVAGSLVDLNELDDKTFWMLIIGLSSMNARSGHDNVLKQMRAHFTSMYEYMDEGSIKKFADQSIMVNDMFELFNYIIVNRTEIVKTVDRRNMLHKELASLEYTLDRLIINANKFKHDIKNATDLNATKVKKLIGKWFKLRDIELAARSSNLIQESTPTDCPILDYGLGVMTQTKACAPLGTKKPEFNPNDTANAIHASLPFAMSSERITAPDPDGRGFLSPTVYLSPTNCIILRPELRDLYNRTERRLTVREPIKRKGKL